MANILVVMDNGYPITITSLASVAVLTTAINNAYKANPTVTLAVTEQAMGPITINLCRIAYYRLIV